MLLPHVIVPDVERSPLSSLLHRLYVSSALSCLLGELVHAGLPCCQLTYTRGTRILCRLRVRSPDKHMLGLLSLPSAPQVTLLRRFRTKIGIP